MERVGFGRAYNSHGSNCKHTERVGQSMGFAGRKRFQVTLVGSVNGWAKYKERESCLEPYLLDNIRLGGCSRKRQKGWKTGDKHCLLSSKSEYRVHLPTCYLLSPLIEYFHSQPYPFHTFSRKKLQQSFYEFRTRASQKVSTWVA